MLKKFSIRQKRDFINKKSRSFKSARNTFSFPITSSSLLSLVMIAGVYISANSQSIAFAESPEKSKQPAAQKSDVAEKTTSKKADGTTQIEKKEKKETHESNKKQTVAVVGEQEGKIYQSARLDNGLEIITVPSNKVPLATFVLVFKAGAMTETPETNGLTHLWEHMFFKGNARLPKQEDFVKRVRELGISYNGDTSAEMVRYYFTLPSAFLEEGMQFMADAIQTAKLDKKELEKERTVVLNEYERNASDPGFEFQNLRRMMLFGDNGYLRDPLGTKKIILGASVKQLETIKNEVFVPANGALMIGGDFSNDRVLALAKKYFGKWKNPKGWTLPKRPELAQITKTQDIIATSKDFQNAQVLHTFNGPMLLENPKDTFASDVLSGLLAHRENEFYKKFIESGKTLSAGYSYHTQAKVGHLVVYAQTAPEKLLEVKEDLLAEIPKWAEKSYFTAQQFEDVRTSLMISKIKETSTPSAFIKQLAFWWAVPGLTYYDSYDRDLMAVTPDDVKSFVEKYLIKKDHLSASLLNEKEAVKLGIKDTAAPYASTLLKAYRD